MDLYIQMGHNMKSLSLEYLTDWKSGTFIISPMNIKPKSIVKFANKVHKLNGQIMFDPQLYYPRKYHRNLSQYHYWPKQDITVLESGSFDSVIKPLAELNIDLQVSSFILPSFTVNEINDRWNFIQRSIIDSAYKYTDKFKLLHTVSLSSDVVKDVDQVEKIVAYVENWNVDGIYIVCEHPSNYYLVDNPLWVSNLLALVAGVKRLHKKVVVGYVNHQMLCLALSKCDAIASGNFLKQRWFQPEYFGTNESDDISRRAIWYYCPQALSEFKIPFLDLAKRMGILDALAPAGHMINSYSDMLFKSSIPTSANYGEKESHRHYLWCLRHQCLSTVRSSYKETLDAQLILLETAEHLLSILRSKGIRGQDRDFFEIIDVNRAAIKAHDIAYQYVLTQEWDSL